MDIAKADIKYIQGIGAKRAELLNKELNVRSVEDLLYYFPYRYIDRSRTYTIREITGSMPYIQLKGRILSFEMMGEGTGKRLSAQFTDGTGTIELVWFKGAKFIAEKYKIGAEYMIFGKPAVFGSRWNIAHPEIDVYDEEIDKPAGLQGYYNTSEKMKRSFMNSKAIQKIMFTIIQSLRGGVTETLPAYVIERSKCIYLNDALRNIHFPQSPDMLRKAEYRLKFEELFYLQLNLLRYSLLRKHKLGGFAFSSIGSYFNDFYKNNLPFELTGAQKRVLREIRQDVGTGRQMNRLLQGDVGSGKTLVGLMTMLMALDNGFQACLMAPTEILATQHFEGIVGLLEGMDVEVVLLTGSTRKKQREYIHEGLQSGRIKIVIGTHALIEDTVKFHNLGMVVIDEQHRFGVEQRSKLWRKNVRAPHVLVMTATPIPRTLAMTLYGDLDVSVIDELPPGRKPIQTIHQFDNKRASLYAAVRKQLELGRQVYVVYPLIEENEKLDYKNLETGFESMKEIFPEYKVCMVHGKMKPAEKDAAMQSFVNHEAHIMVATTVIEVGVNVPNASVMIIESAERFGLSQLHQLRGRVGRGADQSYCILITSFKLSDDTRKRMEIMVRTCDGFEISEADLQLRGPGDIEGTQQSGVAFDLKISNLAKDGQILQFARDIASEIIEKDPNLEQPENFILSKQLQKLFAKKVDWSFIS